MKVKDLIIDLLGFNPEAEVYLNINGRGAPVNDVYEIGDKNDPSPLEVEISGEEVV